MAVSPKGEATREKILDAAQDMILDRGFSGVSVDNLIDRVGVTKGAFFHHFRSKHDMALALIRRYADQDRAFFKECLARGERLSSDPLQQLLITVGLYEELFGDRGEPYPGCLMASYVYELQVVEREAIDIVNENFLLWRDAVTERLRRISKVYPPRIEVDLPSLADGFLVIIEGAFILAKSLHDPAIVVQQLQHYKHYLQLIFRPDPATSG
jgi:TetR/AcrR family transcriptional repressor of nem operon